MTRRDFLALMAAGGAESLVGCGQHLASKRYPTKISDFELIAGFDTYRIGNPDGPAVVLLHELPGLSPDDLALAHAISERGFNVFVPRLFGKVGQDNVALGLAQACATLPHHLFHCENASTRSPILDRLDPYCRDIARHQPNQQIAIIGMCLTGIFPLALFGDHVAAAVCCQPTIPFELRSHEPKGPQAFEMGLTEADFKHAVSQAPPFLAMRYASDHLCPPQRMTLIRDTFKQRVAVIEIPDAKGHSTLAGDQDPRALDDAVNYISVRLKAATGPKPMTLALLQGQPCVIDAAGNWSATAVSHPVANR